MRLAVRSVGEAHPLTRLRIALDSETDPEDTYSEVPYEKGARGEGRGARGDSSVTGCSTQASPSSATCVAAWRATPLSTPFFGSLLTATRSRASHLVRCSPSRVWFAVFTTQPEDFLAAYAAAFPEAAVALNKPGAEFESVWLDGPGV